VSFLKPPKWLSHKIHDLSSSHHPAVPFILGAFTFFLPCGFTQAMQLYALSLGDPLSSGILMAVFALGTMPALLGVGALTSSATGEKLKKITIVAGLLVVTLGISNMQNAFTLLDWHPLAFAEEGYEIDYSAVSIVDGKQLIQMEISERGAYIPNTLTVVEDVPVQWDIFGADFMGCADTLVMRQFGVNTYLKPGSNTVEFTPTKTGRFTFSCSMGMIRGTMNVIPQE
ncbi:MAG: sulfite exporter TauE/SafE family protein, partial [bacterium]|nr:sulfite exporter TauE/SafE family protein [bacterium]